MSKTQKFSRYRLWCSGHGRQQIQETSQVYCFQRREIATEEKGIESCLVENKECIQIIETCKIIFNCSRISIVLGLVSILRFSFPNAEAMSSTFLKCE